MHRHAPLPPFARLLTLAAALLILAAGLLGLAGCESSTPKPDAAGEPTPAEEPAGNGGRAAPWDDYQPAMPGVQNPSAAATPPAPNAAAVIRPGEAVSLGRPLSGTVLGPGKATFVRGATITVIDLRGQVVATATADDRGRFTSPALSPDRYVLRVVDPEGRHFARELRGVDSSRGSIEIELERGYAVHGVVSERSSKRSAAGVRVVARPARGGEVLAAVLSGAAGEFRLAPLREDDIEVFADAPGGTSMKVKLLDDIVRVELSVPDIVYCNGLVLRSVGPVQGHASSAQGSGAGPKPMAGAEVVIRDAEQQEVARTRCSAEGIFALACPPPGTYSVSVTEAGSDAHGEALLVVPAEGSPRPVRVLVEGPGRISGTVSFAADVTAETDIRIWLTHGENDDEPLQVAYVSGGRYAFPAGVSPGSYFVRAIAFQSHKELSRSRRIQIRKDEAIEVDFELE